MITKTYTSESGVEKQVHFEDAHKEEIDYLDHSVFCRCFGYDANGTRYVGLAEYYYGELQDITDIEEI